MNEWRLLGRDAGGLERHARLIGEDTFEFRHSQDVAPLLERNKAMANHNDGWSPNKEMRRVASIPAIIIEKWKNEEGIDIYNPDHASAVARKLNSSEYAYLRTAGGQLGMSNGVMR